MQWQEASWTPIQIAEFLNWQGYGRDGLLLLGPDPSAEGKFLVVRRIL